MRVSGCEEGGAVSANGEGERVRGLRDLAVAGGIGG